MEKGLQRYELNLCGGAKGQAAGGTCCLLPTTAPHDNKVWGALISVLHITSVYSSQNGLAVIQFPETLPAKWVYRQHTLRKTRRAKK